MKATPRTGRPGVPPRILWLKTELLHPVDRGGRIRTYHVLRELTRLHEVTYMALDDDSGGREAVERAGEYSRRLVRVPHPAAVRGSARFFAGVVANLASPLPYVVSKFRSPAMTREIRHLVAAGNVDLIVCDFLFPFVNVPADIPCPVLLFQHNVEAVIWRRHAEVSRQPLARLYLREQWRRMRRFEALTCRRADHVVAVSGKDLALLRSEYGVEHISEVPTGVDVAYFRPSGVADRPQHELVFTGAMDWLPNEDAMAHFVTAILPAIRRAVPTATLTIVGRNPSARVRSLADADGVRVTGGVPDVRPYLERSAVIVVPLRIGGGTRLKIYEAMAMGRPVVSTPVGAEGLPVRDGEQLMLAETPDAFANAVVRLLRDRDGAEAMGSRAASFVRTSFGWAPVAERFSEICIQTASGRGARSLVTV